MQQFWKVWLLLIFASCYTFDSIAASRVEIVLDVSGSMRARMGTKQKIEVAKEAIESTIERVEEGSLIALRFYGHRVEQQKRTESCRDTELVIPFEPLDRNRFWVALDLAVPLGQTPIAYSLEQAAEDLKSAKDEKGIIILVSDGEETCGGDPVEVACKLAKTGIGLTVHTVGFDVDAKTRQQLEEIARCTGGEYRDARNAETLTENLRGLTDKALLIEERRSVYGEKIRGGRTYDEAVKIEPGTYHLDHHQRKDEYDYFYLDVKDGQKIIASITTPERGVEIRGNNYKEGSGKSDAGIEIHNPEHKKIRDAVAIGKNEMKQVWFGVRRGRGGQFYLLVGNSYGNQHQESRFSIQLEDQFDAGSSTDAGSSSNEALTIKQGRNTGYLHVEDAVDYYKISAQPGTLNLKARPEDSTVTLEVLVEDSEGKILKKGKAPNAGAAVQIENIKVTSPSDVLIRVAVRKAQSSSYNSSFGWVGLYPRNFETVYELEVTPTAEKTIGKAGVEAGSPRQ